MPKEQKEFEGTIVNSVRCQRQEVFYAAMLEDLHFAAPAMYYTPQFRTASRSFQTSVIGNRAGCQIRLADKSALKPLRSALKPLPSALKPLASALIFPVRSARQIPCYNRTGSVRTDVQECSRQDAKIAKNEKQLHYVVLGALGVFARDLFYVLRRRTRTCAQRGHNMPVAKKISAKGNLKKRIQFAVKECTGWSYTNDE
jgi:hypothetical protein